jgi:hypothetical protein
MLAPRIDVISYDVTHISDLRRHLAGASFSMKLLGFLSGIYVFAFGTDVVNPWISFILGILVFISSFWLANALKNGSVGAAIVISLWSAAWLVIQLVIAAPPALKDFASGNFFNVEYASLGGALSLIPLYFVARGVIALFLHSARKDSVQPVSPLSAQPWENGKKGIRKHPTFLTWRNPALYVYLALVPCPWLCLFAVHLQSGSTDPSIPVSDYAQQLGYLFAQVCIGLGVWTFMAFLYRRARRHAMLPGGRLAQRDTRPITLYLRSFADDKIKLYAQAHNGRILLERLLPISFEELITDQLWRYGPVVAIGDPRQQGTLAPLGAARTYETDATWQAKAWDLMRRAAIIVGVLGGTQGFTWEMDTIARYGYSGKLTLVIPPNVSPENLIARWNNLVSRVPQLQLPSSINLANVRAIALQTNRIVIITATKRNGWIYEAALDTAAALILGGAN